MIVHLDTSVMIGALTASRPLGPRLMRVVELGDRLNCSTLALYEWLRGPRTAEELDIQETLFPAAHTAAFGVVEAFRASVLFSALGRPRRRSLDLAIAACAIEAGAVLWTGNARDFHDIPGLTLYRPV